MVAGSAQSPLRQACVLSIDAAMLSMSSVVEFPLGQPMAWAVGQVLDTPGRTLTSLAAPSVPNSLELGT